MASSSQNGNATLLALVVLAMVSASLALQLGLHERQAKDDGLTARVDKMQRFAMNAIGMTNDLIRSGRLEADCANGRYRIPAKIDKAAAARLRQDFSVSSQEMLFTFCDPVRFRPDDLAELYKRNGRPPSECKPLRFAVRLGRLDCKEKSEGVIASARPLLPEGSPELIEAERARVVTGAVLAMKPGCPFECHGGQRREKP